jgi:phospholipase/carboxylesterase
MSVVEWGLNENIGLEVNSPQAKFAVCFLHGLGASADDFMQIANMMFAELDVAFNCLLAQAEKIPVSINQNFIMPAWYDIYSLTDFTQQDVVGMQNSAQKILTWVESQISRGVVAKNIFLIGFSQGGALALFSVLSGIVKVGNVIGIGTYLPAAYYLDEIDCFSDFDLTLMHGRLDTVISPATALVSAKKLSSILNKKIHIEWSSNEHNITQEQIDSIITILKQKNV